MPLNRAFTVLVCNVGWGVWYIKSARNSQDPNSQPHFKGREERLEIVLRPTPVLGPTFSKPDQHHVGTQFAQARQLYSILSSSCQAGTPCYRVEGLDVVAVKPVLPRMPQGKDVLWIYHNRCCLLRGWSSRSWVLVLLIREYVTIGSMHHYKIMKALLDGFH